MNEQPLITFEEAYKKAEENKKNGNEKISLLLGNGFSMAYDSKRFSYSNLLESAKQQGIIKPDSKILSLFNKLGTSDFEKVIKTLEDGKLVTETYNPEHDTKQIGKDAENLKKHLVDIITNNHPEKSTEITDEQSKKCANFLEKFNKIYSLNYDLLAYWVILQKGLQAKFEDGFSNGDHTDDYVIFSEKDCNFFFLHGGLHIFDNKTETIKLTFCRTDIPLKQQIHERLKKNIYPVFISEGTSDAKLEKIRHNYYLNRCYKSLRNQGGQLFLFGTILKSNDEHIKKAIIEGKFQKCYIGVFSESEFKDAGIIKEEFENYTVNKKGDQETGKKREAILYDAKTINPWGNIEK
jgi:hypothetical protein